MAKAKHSEYSTGDFVVYPTHGVGKVLGVEWAVSTVVSKRREVCRGMTISRRDNHRINSGVQLVVREFDEFIRYI
jgi:hypothetical protein